VRPTPRSEPPHVGTEVEILLSFLDYHRDTLRRKTEGLDAAQLQRTLGPSPMTLGGLLKHLAFVEDWWFTQVFAGRPASQPWGDVDWRRDPDWDWHSAVDDSPEDLRRLYDESVARSQALLGSDPDLDVVSPRPTEHDPDREFSLRWIVVHMVEEYARHNGHADLVRESVDGQVGE
jgi:uncharacterized damage-inducible protein DinB